MLAMVALLTLTGCARRGGGSGARTERSTSRGKDSSNDRTKKPRVTEPTAAYETTPPPKVETSPETVPESSGPLVFDDRKPWYAGTNPKWETMHFEWEDLLGNGTMQLDIPVDREMYKYYRNLERYYGGENLQLYVNDENNQKIIKDIVAALREQTQYLNYDDATVAKEIAKFVQDAIEYEYDSVSSGREEYPRYPIETLYEGLGDCEDTSILMAALLKEWGYEVGFLHLPGHIAVAVRASDDYSSTAYYEINGHRYLYIESTGSGWKIGDIPDDYLETSVEFFPIP